MMANVKNVGVPHVPPSYLGYLHAGTEVWAKTDSNIGKAIKQ